MEEDERRRRTKVTVVTGMLDAGKTTFIRNALVFESGRKKSEGLN
jgi:G3E family GTPase